MSARRIAVLVLVTVLGLTACYKCKTPDCSDLPPMPDPFPSDVFMGKSDAGHEAGDAALPRYNPSPIR